MKAIAAICCILAMISCATTNNDQRGDGWFILRWAEKPSPHGVSTKADPKDRTQFDLIASYDQQHPETFKACKSKLREGDVIAYWLKKNEARKAIVCGDLTKIGYRLLCYGHLAILVQDPKDDHELLLFSSQSLKGPNTQENFESLEHHSWDVYRLNQWDRIDRDRLHEFVDLAKAKAGNWAGYDFSGMFGLWNSNLEPSDAQHIGQDYICSTIVVAALYYSGLELDAVQRMGMLDLVSPKQVVTSKGRIIDLPDVTLQAQRTNTRQLRMH
jgi:hypothetical protein